MLKHNINEEITTITFSNGWSIEHFLNDRSLLTDKRDNKTKVIYWDSMDLRIVSPTGHVLKWSDSDDMIRDMVSADDLANMYVIVKDYTDDDVPTSHMLEWAKENKVNILECVNHTGLVKIFNRHQSKEAAELQVAEEYKEKTWSH